MYRNETITTKIRPIKKLCIIEDNDIDKLIQIIKLYSIEIGGILNIILINNDKLFTYNTIDFVNNHDPDIIINFSKCDDCKLRLFFKTLVLNERIKGFNLTKLATPLTLLSNMPDLAKRRYEEDAQKDVYTSFDVAYERNRLVHYLNFGLVEHNLWEKRATLFKNTIFKHINIDNIRGGVFGQYGRLLSFLLDYEKNFLYLSMPLFFASEHESIYEKNHNKKKHYTQPTIIFGNNDNIESMIYFWNVRATYPFHHNVWLPVEKLDEYPNIVRKFQNYCLFFNNENAEIKEKIKKLNESIQEVDNSKYYFGYRDDEWKPFEYKQNITMANGKFKFKHPNDRLFSKLGFNVQNVIEISGLDELVLPKSLALGELFKKSPDRIHSPQLFSRVSSKGIAFSFDEIELFSDSAFIEGIDIPDDISIFKVLFKEYKLRLRETNKSQIAKQMIKLINGYENLELLNNEGIFDLLVSLTPKRIQRLVKDICK